MGNTEGRGVVYALIDPRNSEIRYIGFTATSPQHRLGRHIYNAMRGGTEPSAVWMRQLSVLGMMPKVAILKADADYEDERAAIAAHRNSSDSLLNATDGGPGAPGVFWTPERRARLSAAKKGWSPSEQARRNMSAAQKGKPKPPRTAEHCARIAASKVGKVATDETRRKLSASHMGKPGSALTPEQLARRGAAVSEACRRRFDLILPPSAQDEAAARIMSGQPICSVASEYGVDRKRLVRMLAGRLK